MKKRRFTEEQITFALKQAEEDTPAAEIIRKLGITEPIFYRCKQKYGGLMPTEVKR